MDIELLADHQESIPLLVDLYITEWGPYYGAEGPGDAGFDLRSRCNRDAIPVGLVVVEDGEFLGTAAIDTDAATGLSPSIVGLLVKPARRRRGIATALLQRAESIARQLGFRRLYMSTAVLGDLVLAMGWRWHAEVTFHNDESGAIYVKDL